MVFAFWPHQKTGFEASERNKDVSHAPTAHKLTLGALHTIRVAAFLARAPPNQFFKQNGDEEERGEREKKKKEGREREKGRSGASKQPPLNGPSAARVNELCSFAKRCTRVWIVFFFLRTILLRRRGIFAFLPARKCSKMHAKAVL